MLNENVPVLPRHIERDPDKLRQLDRWKDLLRRRHTVALFADGHDLAVRVAADLGRTMQAVEESQDSQSVRGLTAADIAWADIIFVMETSHRRRIVEMFGDDLKDTPIHVLDIPDEFEFMDPELIEMLRDGVDRFLVNHRTHECG